MHGAAKYGVHYEWTDMVNFTENVRSYQQIGFIFCNLKTNHLFD